MPVRIRLSRGGSKKRPYYRIVVADSRRSRDGKFIEQIGVYNPMLSKENPDRVKLDSDKAKDWLKKGAQPSDRLKIFLSSLGIIEKPIITEKTKKHLPKKKSKEKEDSKPAEESKKETPSEEKKENTESKTEESKPAKDSKPAEESKPAKDSKSAEESKKETPSEEKKEEEK